MSPVIVSAPVVPQSVGFAWHNTVTVGPFTADLNSDAGDFRVSAKITGWDDAPQIRAGVEDRSQQDGGWDGSGFYSPRVITIEGVVVQQSHADAKAVADQLMALSPRQSHLLKVDNDAIGLRTATVRVTVGAVLEWIGGEAFTYTLQLTAPDPLKYGHDITNSTTLTTTGGGTGLTYPLAYPRDYGATGGITPGMLFATNDGTADYWPRIKITGPVTNPVLTVNETGDSFRFNGTVEDGQTLDVLCADRRVVLNGYASRRFLAEVSGSWLSIPPGGATLSVAADSTGTGAKFEIFYFEGAWS